MHSNGALAVGMGVAEPTTVLHRYKLTVYPVDMLNALNADNATTAPTLFKLAAMAAASWDAGSSNVDEVNIVRGAHFVTHFFTLFDFVKSGDDLKIVDSAAYTMKVGPAPTDLQMPEKDAPWLKPDFIKAILLLLIAGKLTWRSCGHHLGIQGANKAWSGYLPKVLEIVAPVLAPSQGKLKLEDDETRALIHSVLHFPSTKTLLAHVYAHHSWVTKIKHPTAEYDNAPKMHLLDNVLKRAQGVGVGCKGLAAAATIAAVMAPTGVLFLTPVHVQHAVVSILKKYKDVLEDPLKFGDQAHYLVGTASPDSWSSDVDTFGPYAALFMLKLRNSHTLAKCGLCQKFRNAEVDSAYAAGIGHLSKRSVGTRLATGSMAVLLDSCAGTTDAKGMDNLAELLAGCGMLASTEVATTQARFDAAVTKAGGQVVTFADQAGGNDDEVQEGDDENPTEPVDEE